MIIFIEHMKNILLTYNIRTVHFALVHSHYSNGIRAWGNATKAASHHSTILQKRALRIINNANYNEHVDPLSTAYRSLNLNDLYEHQALMFIFDYITNKLRLSLAGTFQFNRDYLKPDLKICSFS